MVRPIIIEQHCSYFTVLLSSIISLRIRLGFWTNEINRCVTDTLDVFLIFFSLPLSSRFFFWKKPSGGPCIDKFSLEKSHFQAAIFGWCVPAHCIFRLFLIKSNIWPISKIYLTTNQPYVIRFQKNKKIRKLYSPDPDSGSGIPENWDQFFS